MKDKGDLSEFEQRVKNIVANYRKYTIIKDVKCTVVKESSIIYTMYSNYFLPNSLTAIRDLEIVVDQSNQYDPHLEISLCHELGHLENAMRAVVTGNTRILDPTTWFQKLQVEIMADRRAARIYGDPEAKSVVGHWLKDEIKDSFRNFNKFASRRAMLGSLWFFIMRYILNLFSRRSLKETESCTANELKG